MIIEATHRPGRGEMHMTTDRPIPRPFGGIDGRHREIEIANRTGQDDGTYRTS